MRETDYCKVGPYLVQGRTKYAPLSTIGATTVMGAGGSLKQNQTGSVHFGKSHVVAEDETLAQYLLVTKLPIESAHAFFTRETSIAVGAYSQDDIVCR